MKCRHCATQLEHIFLNLGFAPPSNAYLSVAALKKPEIYYPLKINVCHQCWLVQTEDYAEASQLFTDDYAYFSSTSSGWLNHARDFAQEAASEFGLGKKSFVLEVASNDGYLLKNFLRAKIPCLGVEPTMSTAAVAETAGIPVIRKFFGEKLARRLKAQGNLADLIVGNNVYAHVPDINDFTKGLATVLKPEGVISLEFPHLMQLIEQCQFDTIYHEHYSYLSLHTVNRIFKEFGLRVWKVKQLKTHGGSLRVYACHQNSVRAKHPSVGRILKAEIAAGLQDLNTYLQYQERAEGVKNQFLDFLLNTKLKKRKIIAYGAAAKGNTLLNYAGIKPDLLPVIYDAAKAKQGKYLPGSHIPIQSSAEILTENPDYVLILPWNIAPEVIKQLSALKKRGAKFVTAIPKLEIR
jgi:hypothetical protein